MALTNLPPSDCSTPFMLSGSSDLPEGYGAGTDQVDQSKMVPRNRAGNPYSPQAVIFGTSIINVILSTRDVFRNHNVA